MSEDEEGWKETYDITGNGTVRSRYWKNEAYNNPDMYSTKKLRTNEKG